MTSRNIPMNQNIFHEKYTPQQFDLLSILLASFHSFRSLFYNLKSLFQFRSHSTFTDLHIFIAGQALPHINFLVNYHQRPTKISSPREERMSKEVPKEDIKDLLPLVLQLTNVDQVR
jgi:hypothetical protein